MIAGHGDELRCPLIGWDVACQGCTCDVPCEKAQVIRIGPSKQAIKEASHG